MKYIYFLLIVICACKQPAKKQNTAESAQNFTSSVFSNADSTFGYEIYRDSVKVIRQANIPAVTGNKGFNSRDDAGRIAGFVIYKLKSGRFPPTMESYEIDSLLKK